MCVLCVWGQLLDFRETEVLVNVRVYVVSLSQIVAMSARNCTSLTFVLSSTLLLLFFQCVELLLRSLKEHLKTAKWEESRFVISVLQQPLFIR